MAEQPTTREAYGAPVGRFSHLQQQLGQHATELLMAKALANEAAQCLIAVRKISRPAHQRPEGGRRRDCSGRSGRGDASFWAEGYSGRLNLGDRLQGLNGL